MKQVNALHCAGKQLTHNNPTPLLQLLTGAAAAVVINTTPGRCRV